MPVLHTHFPCRFGFFENCVSDKLDVQQHRRRTGTSAAHQGLIRKPVVLDTMKITNLALDRNQRLENLDHGLNVVFHPDDDTLRSVHEAINQVFFSEPSPSGETTEVEIVDDGKTLQLRRGTEADGRRVVTTELTAIDSIGRTVSESTPHSSEAEYDDLQGQDIRQLSQELGTSAARAAYHPEFGSRTSFDQLAQQAREISTSNTDGHSLQALLSELEVQDRWTPSSRYQELEERRQTLQSEINGLKNRLASAEYENTETVNRLRTRLADADQRLHEMEVRREGLLDELRHEESRRTHAESTTAASTSELTRQRELLQTQIERVRAVVRDIDSRIDAQRKQPTSKQPTTSTHETRPGYLPADLEKRLRHLALGLEGAIQRLTQYASEKHCVCRGETERVAERFASLAKCLDDIGGTQVRVTHRDTSHEQQRLEACRRQLNDHLQQLVLQRTEVDDRIANASTSRQEVEFIRSRIRDLRLTLGDLDRQMDEAERTLTTDRERLDQLAFHRDETEQLETRLQITEREVADVNREMQRERETGGTQQNSLLTQLRQSVRETPTHPLVKDLNRLVKDLTGGEYTGIEFPSNRRDVEATSLSDESFSSDILSRPTRDLIQTALAMAVANHLARNGKVRAIVLHDAFQHVPAPRLRACIDLLQDFTRGPHQIILLTTHNSVLSLSKSLGICCYNWDQRVQAAEVPRAHTYETAWDCEEFPGELRDRTRAAMSTNVHQASTHSDYRTTRREPYAKTRGDYRRDYRNAEHTDYSTNDLPSAGYSANEYPITKHSVTDYSAADYSAADYSTVRLDVDESPQETLRVTGHYLELSDRVTEISFIPRRLSNAMTEHGVWTVANLFHADPLLLAERLHHHDVTAAEIRQWQAQARLMCAVRKLRSYDARILVGCGITTPGQLEELHPQEVSRMVEAFVATADGSQIVRSGTAVEIERVTRWIRSLQRRSGSLLGNRDAEERDTPAPTGTTQSSRSSRTSRNASDTNGNGTGTAGGNGTTGGNGVPQIGESEENDNEREASGGRAGRRARKTRNSERPSRSTRRGRSGRSSSNEDTETGDSAPGRTTRRTTRRSNRSSRSARSAQSSVLPMKFHLETSSHVEAAPTIGPRMAERLEAIGIVTVADLFAADASEVARQLDHRRTTAEIVYQWQRQAELVCRVPQIRGHDAQILVACDITSPEQIATFEPHALLAIVEPLCSGPEGKRLLRNNKRPDLEEVTEWIAWASQARQLGEAA